MPARKTINLVIIFDDELRKAGRLLDIAYNLAPGLPHEEKSKAIADALMACRVALYNVRDDDSMLTLGSRRAMMAMPGEPEQPSG